MKFLNGWIDIPDEDLERDTDEEVKVCQYCQADPSGCGEWAECCYNGVIREIQKMESTNTDKTLREHAPWEAKVFDFRTGEVVDWEDL